MKLSIIVPVYNVERYVRRCVLSIINQDDNLFNDIQLIIVNDGTPDNSVYQIQDLIDNYPNIELINQNNQGLSMARNNGMDKAVGDYLWFIDSDDWIAPNSFKEIMPLLDGKTDLVTFGIYEKSECLEVPKYVYSEHVLRMTGKDTFIEKCEHSTFAQKAIYKKRFLIDNNLRFMPGIYNEDDEFCPRASYYAEHVTLIPVCLYYYFKTSNEDHATITNSANPKLVFDFLVAANSLKKYARNTVKESIILQRFDYYIAVLVNNALNYATKCKLEDQKRFCSLYKSFELNKNLRRAGGKYSVESFLFLIFPNNLPEVYKYFEHIKRRWL